MQYIVPNWPAPKAVQAYTTTRESGYSDPPYASFNLAHHVGDEYSHVEKNRALLVEQLQLPSLPLWLQQEHGCRVFTVQADKPYSMQQADAITTQAPNRVCVVMTADCLPLLLCNFTGTCIAAIHAGWRGLAAGILQQAVQQISASPNDLMAWLGPAIGPEAYIVSEEVRNVFLKNNEEAEKAFQPKAGKWLANLYDLATLQLHALGVKKVYGGEYCTYNSKYFYSYRRDQGVTGRMATLIWLNRQERLRIDS